MATGPSASAPKVSRRSINIALLLVATISVALESKLTIHELLGLIFIPLVIYHLYQRRAFLTKFFREILQPKLTSGSFYRAGLSTILLVILTLGMLISGIYDWWVGSHHGIRWHAIFGVLLSIQLVIHSFNRRRKIMKK